MLIRTAKNFQFIKLSRIKFNGFDVIQIIILIGTDTILDFEVGIDRIGLVEGELTFAELTLTQDGNNTLLGVADSGETLAILNNVQASILTENSFAVVPDVSNPNKAITLI
ncbi:MAG: hypothetical protein AAFX51_17450 [Cyanobacteria bacterium J06636_28]